MGMLDTLGPTILGKPTQIISFAINIVQDHVDRFLSPSKETVKKESKFPDFANIVSQEDLDKLEDLHDEQFSAEDDFESLLLAINLLRAVMHGKTKKKKYKSSISL